MKKYTAVFSVLIVLACGALAAETNDISLIEKEILGIEYKDENITDRVNRLEKHLFGQQKSGNIANRIKFLCETTGISLAPKLTKEEERIAKADLEPEDFNVTYPVIDMMEQKSFQKIYQGENVYKRVERLEKKAFGKTIDGDLAERTDRLKASILAVNPEKITYDENFNPQNINKYSSNGTNYEYGDSEFLYSNPLLTKKAHNSYPSGAAAPLNESYYNSYGNNISDFEFALTAAENMILGKDNKSSSVHERLNNLEKKIFKKTYNGDNLSRLDRIVSAAHAQKTGKIYKENKWDRYITTGLQVGTIVLMILGMIL